MRRWLWMMIRCELRDKRTLLTGSIGRNCINQSHIELCVSERGFDDGHNCFSGRVRKSTARYYQQLEASNFNLSQLVLHNCIDETHQMRKYPRGTAASSVCKHDKIVGTALNHGK